MSAVSFEGVSKRYRLGLSRTSLPSLVAGWVRRALPGTRAVREREDLWALRDVSFQLHPGESLALLGANGAGKTTILKLLAHITEPTSGRVAVNGRLSALIELGAGFHPDLTGRDNAFLNGTILGLSRRDIQRRFDEIVDFSGLERFIDTPVKRYSSGMVVRLGFAVAACVEPEILLVDEVLAVGDAAFSQKCLARIASLSAGGTAIVFVSHNLYLAKAVCRRALYLREGRVQADGGTADLIRQYERDVQQERLARLARAEPDSVLGQDLVEITGIDVVGAGASTAAGDLSNRRAAEVHVRYTAYSDVGPAHVSIWIRRADGLLCSMLRTSLHGIDLDLRRGAGTISIRIDPLLLSSGTYFVEAYVLDATDSVVLTPGGGRSPSFTVSGLSHEENAGVFEPPVTWSHQPAAAGVSAVAEAAAAR